jgi:hypothetical protein
LRAYPGLMGLLEAIFRHRFQPCLLARIYPRSLQ